jgi:hypothetical protein
VFVRCLKSMAGCRRCETNRQGFFFLHFFYELVVRQSSESWVNYCVLYLVRRVITNYIICERKWGSSCLYVWGNFVKLSNYPLYVSLYIFAPGCQYQNNTRQRSVHCLLSSTNGWLLLWLEILLSNKLLAKKNKQTTVSVIIPNWNTLMGSI